MSVVVAKTNDLSPLYFVLYGVMYAGFMRIIALPLFSGERGKQKVKHSTSTYFDKKNFAFHLLPLKHNILCIAKTYVSNRTNFFSLTQLFARKREEVNY